MDSIVEANLYVRSELAAAYYFQSEQRLRNLPEAATLLIALAKGKTMENPCCFVQSGFYSGLLEHSRIQKYRDAGILLTRCRDSAYHIRSVRNIPSRTHTRSPLLEELCRVPVQAQQMPHQVVFPLPLAVDAVPYLLQEA